MKWELGALKVLARHETVPGVALRDAIREIERLTDELEKMKIRCILKLDPDSPIQKLNLFPEQDQPG